MRGLVLEGGGIKGSYQIGSYYAFLKCRYSSASKNVILEKAPPITAAMLACKSSSKRNLLKAPSVSLSLLRIIIFLQFLEIDTIYTIIK